MSLITLLVVLIVLALLLYLVNSYLPVDVTLKRIINIVVILIVCLWLLSAVGILPDLNAVRVGK